jgi:serine/threonine protein phosphatase PrpC
MAYPFLWGAASDIGRFREKNEDAFVVSPESGLFLVLDGLGGHAGGDVAARAAADELPILVAGELGARPGRRPRSTRGWLARVIRAQSRRIHLLGLTGNGYPDMGATLALVLLLDGRAYAANLGDSRVYRFRAGRLVQLSRDHSAIRELLEQGQIEPEEAAYHPAGAEVTQYVGMPDDAEPYVRACALRPGDQYLLCTDGLTNEVPDARIREIVESHDDCEAACEALVATANAHGGLDNITVVLLRWTGEPA